jgi:AraC-like DNA-binding protein
MRADAIIPARGLFEMDQYLVERYPRRTVQFVREAAPDQASRPKVAAAVSGLTGWQMKKLCEYIDANMASRIPIADLAELVHVSVGHFFRAFKASSGVSPHAYIMGQRIRRAAVLVGQSDEPLASIAIDCGLCDQAHLTHVFRRVLGVTPNVLRLQCHTRSPNPGADRLALLTERITFQSKSATVPPDPFATRGDRGYSPAKSRNMHRPALAGLNRTDLGNPRTASTLCLRANGGRFW